MVLKTKKNLLPRADIQLLIVDDEEGIRDSLAMNFEIDGFKVIVAGNGHEAIELLKTKKIDFIISDVRMPKADGVILLKYVAEFHKDSPKIVLVSGFTELSTTEAIELGALDLMQKPPCISRLVELIQKHCHCI
jgi:DNA-binding NtrC family response regulator